jgi:type IV pilus assembly protein PilM
LDIAEAAGLRPVAVDVEPAALLRSYVPQFRRDEDQQRRRMFVNVGASNTVIVIARDGDPLFVKYVDVGGRHFDEAVARQLTMPLAEAATLRRHNGDRREDQRESEVTKSVEEAIRPVLERLAQEIALCIRYYSVTFRGQPLGMLVLSGGEANASLVQWLAARIDVPCELGNPLRAYPRAPAAGRSSQWDIAAGLALREVAP